MPGLMGLRAYISYGERENMIYKTSAWVAISQEYVWATATRISRANASPPSSSSDRY